MNCLILGWVTKAMTAIVAASLGTNERTALWICVFFLIPFTGLYVTLGGLWGVLWTDLFQFVLKMSIVIVIAYYAVQHVGGMSSLINTLNTRASSTPGAASPLGFFPSFSRGVTAEPLWTVPVLTFLVNIG